jgi:phasin family protein
MATTPKKISETPRKAEPLVIIPDSVADFTPPAAAPAVHAPEILTDVTFAPARAVEAVVVAQVEPTIESAAKVIEAAQPATVAQITHNSKTEMTHTMDKAMKTAEEFVTFGQGNLEAIMKSNQIWMTGLQDMSKAFAATAQAQMEETVSTMKTFAGLRSLKDAMDLQTSFARTSFEKAMSESGKITESSLKLAEQAMAPITARVTIAMEKFGKAA